jgi:hypothetical protein
MCMIYIYYLPSIQKCACDNLYYWEGGKGQLGSLYSRYIYVYYLPSCQTVTICCIYYVCCITFCPNCGFGNQIWDGVENKIWDGVENTIWDGIAICSDTLQHYAIPESIDTRIPTEFLELTSDLDITALYFPD